MFKTKETTPYLRVNFHIWLLEKLCGRTLKRKGVKITTQPYEKEEMVYTDTNRFNLVGYKIPTNVAVVVAIVVILSVWVIYHFNKSISFYSVISIPIFVLLVAFFDKFLPDCIRRSVNSLLAKEYERFRSNIKKTLDEQKNKKA